MAHTRAAFIAVIALAVLAPAAEADHNTFALLSDGIGSPDPEKAAAFKAADPFGARVIFTTSEQLVAGDGDFADDLYARQGGVTTLLSDRLAAGVDENKPVIFGGAYGDAYNAYFMTDEALVSADTDTARDVYGSGDGGLFLVSDHPTTVVDANVPAQFGGATAGGLTVFFRTDESMVAADGDTAGDVYQVKAGTKTLVSDRAIAGADEDKDASFEGVSSDGSEIYFTTTEALTIADGDTTKDVYARTAAGLALLSDRIQGGADSNTATLHYGGNSADGSRVFWTTTEPLLSTDADDEFDVYERAGTTTTLVSDRAQAGADADKSATFEGASLDGGRVFFGSDEAIVAADTDTNGRDIFERVGGTTRLVTGRNSGPETPGHAFFGGASDDGTVIAFSTWASLSAADTDGSYDIYAYKQGVTFLLSDGPGSGTDPEVSASFGGISRDGKRVFYGTEQALVSADGDTAKDVYEYAGGAVSLASDGPAPADPNTDAFFLASSADGSRAFLATAEPLATSDTDASSDIYAASYVKPPTPAPDADGDGVPDGVDNCPQQAAQSEDGCPAATPPAPAPPPPALAVTLGKLAKSIKLATLRSKGIAITVEPNLAASFTADLRGNRGLAKAAVGDVVLAEAKLGSATGRRTLRVKIPAAQRKRLKRRAKLTLRVVATDALGRTLTLTRTVKIG
jgi:hypothetical protein